MNKKWAILITVVIVAAVYVFLFMGIPAIENMILPCGNGDLRETTENLSAITGNWTPIGPPLDVRSYTEIFKAPLIIYFIPGVIGVFAIVVILKQRKEAGNE